MEITNTHTHRHIQHCYNGLKLVFQFQFGSSLASMTPAPTIVEEITLPNSPTISELQRTVQNRLRSSLENIVDVPDDEGPLVTFPDEGGSGCDLQLELR